MCRVTEAMANTASVAVTTAAYVSLGTGPMYISPEGPVMIVVATSQPAASAVGHGLDFLQRAVLIHARGTGVGDRAEQQLQRDRHDIGDARWPKSAMSLR